MLFRECVFPLKDDKSAIGGLLFAILGIQWVMLVVTFATGFLLLKKQRNPYKPV